MNDIALEREAAAHDARNVALLAKLAGKGVDLQSTRMVDLYFWATSEPDATQLAEALTTENFERVRVAAPSGTKSRWSVEVRAKATPHAIAARDYTRSLVQLAATHNAQYDGWGTEI